MNTLDRIFQTVDLRDIVEDIGIDLQVRNDKWSRGLCPFHQDDKVPNLDVGTNYYRCYACGQHGSMIDFVAKYYNITKTKAVDRLCEFADIDSADFKPNANRHRTTMKKTEPISLDEIKEVLTFMLDNTPLVYGESRQYLYSRGISSRTIKKMNIRYMSNPHTMTSKLLDRFPLDMLQKLNIFNKRGGFVLFYHRILFPYFYHGEPVFLQGRILGDDADGIKYLNVGQVVPWPYNFDDIESNTTSRTVFIAEGVTDTLALMQKYQDEIVIGIPGIYHLKDEWIARLKDYRIVSALDADDAGRKGYLNICNKFKPHKTSVKRMILPSQFQDYNDYYRNAGKGVKIV